ncbi:hypothetical protein [Cedecea sp. NFIX57]|uniref:hypothetical protein n=1 Tax=Cedecea sp. NFIX57 TaxID=1566286 RepID=UPI000A0DE1CC|nr:hypothetical protein [Cedecea sp. NFIX57]SMG43778.1 5'-nucleotidase [Cedecea sp. NFIX57]
MKKNIIAGLVLTLIAGSAFAAERPMRILIVNDDGCESVGTTSLHDRLRDGR